MARKPSYTTYSKLFDEQFFRASNPLGTLKIDEEKLPKKMTERQWANTYAAAKNDGHTNINNYLVSRQFHVYSPKQAAAMVKAARASGQFEGLSDYQLKQVLRYDVFNWDDVDEYYFTKIKEGMTPTQAKIAVSQYFFGSP